VRPQAGSTVTEKTPAPKDGSQVRALREQIAELRLRARVAQAQPERVETLGCRRSAAVRIFDPEVRPRKSMSAERDVSRRQDELLKLLRERGPMRLIGAQAGEALADRIAMLHVSHPNFATATDYLLQEEILARHRGKGLAGIRLLLHGGAGLGKTDYALHLAELIGLPTQVIGFSSAQASAALGGSETYWSNSEPGIVWKELIEGDFANWVCVMDEIDKADKRAGDPLGALYQLLEERSAKIFTDKSVPWLPVDASYINWIATANDLSLIHPAILSRFTLIEAMELTVGQRAQLAQRLYRQVVDEHGLQGKLSDTLEDKALKQLTRGSVRDLKRILRQAVAIALRRGAKRIEVSSEIPAPARTREIGFIRQGADL